MNIIKQIKKYNQINLEKQAADFVSIIKDVDTFQKLVRISPIVKRLEINHEPISKFDIRQEQIGKGTSIKTVTYYYKNMRIYINFRSQKPYDYYAFKMPCFLDLFFCDLSNHDYLISSDVL